MRDDKINIRKSIAKKRLKRNTALIEPIFDAITYLVLVASFPILTGAFVLMKSEGNHDLTWPIIIFAIALCFSGLMLYSIINLTKLKAVSGLTAKENRNLVAKIAREFGWKITVSNARYTMLTPPGLLTDWGQQVVVIYSDRDILINSTSYGLHDLKSPFHIIGNRRNVRELSERFLALSS